MSDPTIAELISEHDAVLRELRPTLVHYSELGGRAVELQKRIFVAKLRELFPDVVLDELKKLTGRAPKDKEFPQITLATYAGVPSEAKQGKARIAVLVAEGEIVDGEGGPGEIGAALAVLLTVEEEHRSLLRIGIGEAFRLGAGLPGFAAAQQRAA